jgi:hypothetical protein
MGEARRTDEVNKCVQIFVGNPERKRTLGRPRHRWKVNITVNHTETVRRGVGWIRLAQDRNRSHGPVNTVMNFGFHKRQNFWTGRATVSLQGIKLRKRT